MIKNIIFDMGNVLLTFDPSVSLQKFLDTKEDRELVFKELFQGPEWIMGDEGKITNGQRFELVKGRVPERLHQKLKLCVENWDMCMKPVEGAVEFVNKVKEEGYGIYILSNACNRFYGYFPHFFSLELFDGVVVSSDVKMIKPNPEIYEYICGEYQLKPEECLFIDDREENVDAAKKTGMNGVVFTGKFEKVQKLLEEKK